ncbi:hypothetical protein JXR93_01310 [bacterium]|nr:hypothetical protein [bacterium]
MNKRYNPIRRNKNIGTSKSGYKKNNILTIPNYFYGDLVFWVRVSNSYEIIKKEIFDKEIVFIIEKTKKDYSYSVTVDDIISLLKQIPKDDWSGINHFFFRQAKRKEEIFQPVWGRLGYNVNICGFKGAAIVLEAVKDNFIIKWSKSLDSETKKEFNRLISDGHQIEDNGRLYLIKTSKESIRNTQLYRTIIHEIGHWVHWKKEVLEPSKKGLDYDKLNNRYHYKISRREKEIFAHNYADQIGKIVIKS